MSKMKFLSKLAEHLIFRKKQLRSKMIRNKIGRIGKGCIVNPESVIVEKNIYMDDYSIIQNGVNFISNKGKLYLGKYSVIASGCVLIPEKHRFKVGISFYTNALEHVGDEIGDIIIKEDCWLGANSIIIGSRVIGRGSTVGAGSVVTKDIPPYAVVAGNPARIIAVKFSKEDILRHEMALYPPEERMSVEQIEKLFFENFEGVRICN